MTTSHPGDSVFVNVLVFTATTDRAYVGDINQCVEAGADIYAACSGLYGWGTHETKHRAARGEFTFIEFMQALSLARNRTAREP